MNGYFKINWANVKSAAVYGLLTIVVVSGGVALESITAHGSIYGLDWADVLDKSALATIGVVISFISVLKNLLTNDKGEFLGVVEVIPDKKK